MPESGLLNRQFSGVAKATITENLSAWWQAIVTVVAREKEAKVLWYR